MNKVLQDLDGTHRIYQYPEGFSFGTDAVLLSGFIRTRKGAIGAELGTGTGIIPLLLSIHRNFEKIYALEIQKDYVSLARENIALNGFSDKVEIIEGDLKEAKRLLPEKIDFVFSNPPYMKKASGAINQNEKKSIARHEIHCNIDDVCHAAGELLQDKGEFFCVWRVDRLCDLIDAMRREKLEPKDMIFVCASEKKVPKLVLIRAVKGARVGLKVPKNFILQKEDGSRTDQARLLYEKGIIRYGENK